MTTVDMLDLCCGIGGASAAMRERGRRVIGVDNNPALRPDVVADIRALPFRPFPVRLLWISLPCDGFARCALPWIRGPEPSLELAFIAVQLIRSWPAITWAIECSSISRKWLTPVLGPVRVNSGGHAVWTNKPILVPNIAHHKERCSGLRPELRAKVPYEISASFA